MEENKENGKNNRKCPIFAFSLNAFVLNISAVVTKRKMFLFLMLMLILISPRFKLTFSYLYAHSYACAYFTSVN